MERLSLRPRANWQQRVEAAGMTYHTVDGEIYWDESACYRFSAGEIDTLEAATEELQRLCLAAVDHVITHDLFDRLQIPRMFVPYVTRSWEQADPSLYGRFDLAFNGVEPPKLLEYNADTPTAILEASVIQWLWLEDLFPQEDQFNSIHEKLIDFWQKWPWLKYGLFHFTCAGGSTEDLGNLEYLRDTAIQGGFATRQLFIEDIGWHQGERHFVDLEGERIDTLFKLYPWEWLVREPFGAHLPETSLRLLEPAWKMILSNKGILPLLWELFPEHPNLLEAHFDNRAMDGDVVRKPLFSREGANVGIRKNGVWTEAPGSYGGEGLIYQRFAPLPIFAGNHAVTGSWIIGGEAAGIGMREDRSEITTNASRFVPHYFSP